MKQKQLFDSKENKHILYNFTNSKSAYDYLIYIISCGFFVTDSTFITDRESFDSYLAVYLQEGEFYYIDDDDNIFRANAGSLILINCYKHHCYGTVGQSKFYWMHFAGGGIERIFEYITADGHYVFKENEFCQFKELLISTFDACTQNFVMSETRISSKIYSAMCELIEDTAKNDYTNYNNMVVSSVLDYISVNYKNDITTADMARHAQVSQSYMTRLFREISGQSPYAALKNYRLRHASELLAETSRPIKDIAFEVGFNSESNFIFAFKNYAGISPGKYRENKQKNSAV